MSGRLNKEKNLIAMKTTLINTGSGNVWRGYERFTHNPFLKMRGLSNKKLEFSMIYWPMERGSIRNE